MDRGEGVRQINHYESFCEGGWGRWAGQGQRASYRIKKGVNAVRLLA